MSAQLPPRPSLRFIQELAKDLLKSHRQGKPDSCAVLRAHPRFRNASDRSILAARLSLQMVQHAVAHHYGFDAWSDLRTHVEAAQALRETTPAADVLEELHRNGNKASERMAARAMQEDVVLNMLFQGVSSADKRIKNASAKALQLISEKDAAKLCREFELFDRLLDGEDNILKWIACDVIGNMAGVDSRNRLDEKLVAKFLRLLEDPVMITAAHATEALGKIAQSKLQHRQKITATLVEPDSVRRHPECHNILAGKRIDAMALYADVVKDAEPLLAFARGQLRNTRNATRRKADIFVRKFASPKSCAAR